MTYSLICDSFSCACRMGYLQCVHILSVTAKSSALPHSVVCMILGPQITRSIPRSSLLRLETGVDDIHSQISNLQVLHKHDYTVQNQLLIQKQNETQQLMSSILSSQNRLQMRMDLVEAATTVRAAESAAVTISESSENLSSSIYWNPLKPVRLEAGIPGPNCAIGCRCSCHMRRVANLSSLHRFLGSLFVGYIGLPLITPKCNDSNCRQHAHLITSITYVFPP